MVEFLLNNGANPNMRNDVGNTPLHWACSHGNEGVVSLLIANGAKLYKNGIGRSPIEIAKQHNKQEIVSWLRNNT